VEDLRVEECLGVSLYVADHLVDEILRLPATRSNKDPIPAVDVAKYLVKGSELLWTRFSELV